MSNFFADIAETFAVAWQDAFKTAAPTYCDIETADSKTSLVTKNGTLVSGLRIGGIKSPVGPQEFEDITSKLATAFSSLLANPGHTIDVFASRDPEAGRRKVEEIAGEMRKTADRVQLELEDVIDSNVEKLSEYVAEEEIYIAVWSRPSLLTQSTSKVEGEDLAKKRSQAPRTGKASQDAFRVLPSLREKHEAAVVATAEDIKACGFRCEIMTAHEMLYRSRMQIDPDFTHRSWRPHLLGDPYALSKGSAAILRNERKMELDLSDIQAPPVDWQMFPRDAYKAEGKYVVIGDRAYAPVFVEVASREITPFSKLFDKLASTKMPWRCQFRMDGGGMRYIGMKNAFAELLAFTASVNKQISSSIVALRGLEFAGNSIARVRMSFCTWAPANQLGLLSRRASTLAQTIASWGQCEVREASGDPMLGFVSTVPFLTEQCAATPSVAPVEDLVRMLPIFRPSAPWNYGTILLRSLDGKLMPFHPGSKEQTTWVYLLAGRPGTGKSMQMVNLLLSACMAPGASRLPRVGIVDIGPSSAYFLEMLRQSLPVNKRHEVASFTLTMEAKDAINPMDTPLGCRAPLPEHKQFLVNLIAQLATPAEMDKPYARMSELVSKVIEDVYDKFSDKHAYSTPKRYSVGVERSVDETLKSLGYAVTRETSWWNVTDYLYSKGYTHLATLAQRHAVPTISDCASPNSAVSDTFGGITVESGESLPKAFASMMSSVARDYPNLSSTTRFDIGEARVCSINLEQVAKKGSRAADKQASVMYMLASYVLTRDYRLNETVVEYMDAPDMYREYHLQKARETKEELKWIAYDEFHRTSSSPMVQESVLIDIREGRKFKVGVILSSQQVGDFSESIRGQATGVFLAEAGNANNLAELQSYFKFSDTAKELMKLHATGPKSSGLAMMCIISTKDGEFTQLLVSTLGPAARWALSTTMDDVIIREKVCSKLGAKNGRLALTKFLPDSGQPAVEKALAEGQENPHARIADDVVNSWRAIESKS